MGWFNHQLVYRKYAVGTTVGPWNNRLEQMNYEEPVA